MKDTARCLNKAEKASETFCRDVVQQLGDRLGIQFHPKAVNNAVEKLKEQGVMEKVIDENGVHFVKPKPFKENTE